MPKLTVQEVRNDGWREQQFGGGFANPAAFDAVLQSVADEAGRYVEARIGAVPYAAADGHVLDCLRRAELHHAQAVLWRRRATYADSAGAVALQGTEYLNRREYLAHAREAEDLRNAALLDAARALGIDLAEVLDDLPSLAVGHVETGRYPLTSETALNG